MNTSRRFLSIAGSLLCLVGLTLVGRPAPDATAGANERIVFQSNRSGTFQIYSMQPDGAGVQRLTRNNAADVGPALSPDGTRIAFVSNRDGADQVYLMEIDGGRPHRLTRTAGAEVDPVWSPDGSRVYFRKEIGDRRTALCVATVAGGEIRQLTDGSVRYLAPDVSPDGKTILCASGSEIWALGADGGNPRRIARIDGTMAAYPRWSPDGRRIAVAVMTGLPPNHRMDIATLDADGTGTQVLTHSEGISEYPAWSPDGVAIVFQSSRDGNFEIYRMNADGGAARRLTNDQGIDGRPNWGRWAAGTVPVR